MIISPDQAARLVIGQTTFTSQTAGASDTLLGSANGLAFAGDTLFVADSNKIGFTPVNNRVLLFKNTSQTMPSPLAERFRRTAAVAQFAWVRRA